MATIAAAVVLVLGLGLGLCGTAAEAQVVGKVTPGQKAQILNWARGFFADPYSLRSTRISDVVMVEGGVPAICIEFNAKSQIGAYSGIQRTGFAIKPGGLVKERYSGLTNESCYERQISIKPFPELSSIR